MLPFTPPYLVGLTRMLMDYRSFWMRWAYYVDWLWSRLGVVDDLHTEVGVFRSGHLCS